MGSLGDGDDDAMKKPIKRDSAFDFIETETQIFDSRFSPSSSFGKELDVDELQFLQSTVPFDDTVPAEEVFETQAVNLGGETQVVNLGGETQVVNLGGETQDLNLGGETQVLDDPDWAANMDTQLLDECNNDAVVENDGEGTDRTEVLDDIEELSDDDSIRRVGKSSMDAENMLNGTLSKEIDRGSKAEVDALSNELHSSELRVSTATPLEEDNSRPKTGFVQGGFTSVRTASLRASGLAARRKASMDTNSQYLKEHIAVDSEVPRVNESSIALEKADMDYTSGEYNEQTGIRNESKCRVGSSTVRKLFTEETILQTDEASELPHLSYVNSQEPGDLSQANALDFVEKFLETSIADLEQEADLRKSSVGKEKQVSSAKGTQSLAKRANLRDKVRESGIYDWDDSREDEGGGEFFSKKKEAFFSKGSGDVSETRKKSLVEVHSKSRLVLHNQEKNGSKAEATEILPGKNLIKDFYEELNVDVSNRTEVLDTDKDFEEMVNGRFDTQMAAEAMEDLFYGVNGSVEEETKDRARSSKCDVISRPSKQKKRVSSKLSKESPVSLGNQSKNAKKKSDGNLVKAQTRRAKKADSKENFDTYVSENLNKVPSEVVKQGKEEIARKRSKTDGSPSGCISVKKQRLQDQLYTCTPVACRTRHCKATNQFNEVGSKSKNERGEKNDLNEVGTFKGRRKRSGAEIDAFEASNAKEKLPKLTSNQSGELENVKVTEHEQPEPKFIGKAYEGKIDEMSYPRRRRTPRKGSSKQPIGLDGDGQSITRVKRSITNDRSTCMDLSITRQTRSSSRPSLVNTNLEASPTDTYKSASVTPVNCTTPVNAASPICMGDEYLKQSCRKNLAKASLMKEINSLIANGSEPVFSVKDSRRRRDMVSVRVLFSHHLDESIIKQQKKILSRLGASVASSISNATHFITDKFVRTRNMLEAIAFGKPVVTHLWLESCGQASCSIDEKNYILRDAKKEKEFGFSLPVSLARASERPLLQGQKVFITPNTKPGQELLASLVKAVQGMAVERLGRSAMKDDKVPDDLLVLSCEEDYALCVPFLKKGATVYSSELLLNGIVTQKLEYQRHRLFADHVKRTRSTIWLKKDSNQFLPVHKCK